MTETIELEAEVAKRRYRLESTEEMERAGIYPALEYESDIRWQIGRLKTSMLAMESAYNRAGRRPDEAFELHQKETDESIADLKRKISDSQVRNKGRSELVGSLATVIKNIDMLVAQRGLNLRPLRHEPYLGSDPVGDYNSKQAKRKAFLSEDKALEKRPIPLTDFAAGAVAKAKARAADGKPTVSRSGDLRWPVKALSLTADLPGDVIPAVSDLEGFVIALHFDAVVDLIQSEAKRIYADLPEPISDQLRAAEHERIAKELKALEVEEAVAFWAAWDRGFVIAPRPDIHPAALLLVE